MFDSAIKSKDPKFTFHENQRNVAERVMNEFVKRSELTCVMIVALTQSGKTGAAIWLSSMFMRLDRPVLVTNIFIITGCSSKAWVDQTKKRIPPGILANNVYHLGTLKAFSKAFKNADGRKVIIIDEVQVASEERQTIGKTFNRLNLNCVDDFKTEKVRLVELSATPDGAMDDILNWTDTNNYHVEIMQPGEGYVSCGDLLKEGRVFQAYDLSKVKDDRLSATIQNFNEKKYHIIRTPNKRNDLDEVAIHNFVESCDLDANEYISKKYDLDDDTDLNELLKKQPEKHTYIFVKEKFRCSKSLEKTHIGIMYERRPKKIQHGTIIQGLLGRVTGHGNFPDIVVYTNVDSIDKYMKMYEERFRGDSVSEWRSYKTKKTFNQLGIEHEERRTKHMFVPIPFRDYEEFKKECEKKKYKPKIDGKERDEHGFIKCSFKILNKSVNEVCSEDVYNKHVKDMNVGIGEGTKFRCFVYYENMTLPPKPTYVLFERRQ